ncbi:MAG: hypothetical protein KIT33_02195 [Candidatus Kapabacteria bacterium]|nr:hypothetical protein [Ignavibacteriota bacterium]MCW5883760.1 hypothetical protein [Candidatus Kapabacteria bacterium]
MYNFTFINLVIVFFTITSLLPLYSNSVVLVQGKLINKSNNKPIGTKIKFIDDEGKEITSSSNSGEGDFQIVVPSGKKYDVIIEGWLQEKDIQKIDIPVYNSYSELGYEFLLTPLKQGISLASGAFFEKNSEKFNSNFDEVVSELKKLLKHQKGIILEAKISSADSYFKSYKVKENYLDKKGKKKVRDKTVTTEVQLNDLLDKRKLALEEILSSHNIPLKSVNISTELIVNPPKPKVKVKTKGKNKSVSLDELFSENLIITIAKVMKF